MNDIQLNFINESNDQNNSEVVIFQKNEIPNYEDIAIAWKVIKSKPGEKHKFTYPTTTEVSASDAWGNEIPRIETQPGQSWDVVEDTSGKALKQGAFGTPDSEIEVRNQLPTGTVNANVYRGGKLLAAKTDIVPKEKAVFEFKPVLYINTVSQIDEGDVMSSAVMGDKNTKLDLTGITSADIVMRGGGTGPNASPFQFSLENINS
jgi:hypothetical protein